MGSWQAGRMPTPGAFTLSEARAVLADLRPTITGFIDLRADTAELARATQGGPGTTLGGLPEFKAAQARLDELMTAIQQAGCQVKGFAPLLLDFPAELGGEDVLLCWLEGDDELAWYHRLDLGFAGRRLLP
jgi:arsenite methyltransferase